MVPSWVWLSGDLPGDRGGSFAGMRTTVVAAIPALLIGAGTAGASPPGFPDLDSYPAVDSAQYQVMRGHPSTSGWAFRTPAGLRCQSSLIAELGVFCRGPEMSVSASLTRPAELSGPEAGADETVPYPLLPTGFRIDTGNGVVCAVPDEATLACRAAIPESWPADNPDPPDRQYGEHGFVVGPQGTRVY